MKAGAGGAIGAVGGVWADIGWLNGAVEPGWAAGGGTNGAVDPGCAAVGVWYPGPPSSWLYVAFGGCGNPGRVRWAVALIRRARS